MIGSNCFKFGIELDDSAEVGHEVARWKACETTDDPLPPLVLEVSLDISQIAEKDTLFIVSEHGQCDVLDYLKDFRSLRYFLREPKTCYDEIILERWKIEYSPTVPEPDQDFDYVLPTFYKQCIVHFRALYTIASLLPTWRLCKQIMKERVLVPNYPLAIRYRISASNEDGENEADMLSQPVFDEKSSSVTSQITPDDIQAPLGTLSAKVTYRKECSFFVKSDHRTEAPYPVGRRSRSLYGLDDDQYRQSQRTIRSSSLPGEASGSGQSSLGHLASSFLARGMREKTLSTLVSPLEEIGFETSRDAKGFNHKNFNTKYPSRRARDGSPPTTSALSKAIKEASARLFGDDNVFGDHPGISGADHTRGREQQPVKIETSRGSRRNSSAHSNASSGRGSSPASLRNISLAPKEFDPSIPTLRHNYSSPDLQDWSNVQAKHSRQNSDSSLPIRSSRTNSLAGNQDDISDFLALLDRKKDLKSFEPASSAQSESRTSDIGAGLQSIESQNGSSIPTNTPLRRRRSLTAGMPPTLRDVPVVPESVIASSESGSPKPIPITRYKSSFTHRRGRLPSGI